MPLLLLCRNCRFLLRRSVSTTYLLRKKEGMSLEDLTPDKIRNFSVIAHIDHGKSTLADRLLEITGTVEKGREAQILDKLSVERERGITVKAQSASMFYKKDGTRYLLNLIDTPGHVDFHYEVSRSLAAVEGVLLLVDANQGVQAQTVANFWLAFERNLTMIPVLNKIDLKEANPELVEEQIAEMFDLISDHTAKVSAKTGQGMVQLLDSIVTEIPPPISDRSRPLKALIFDSWFVPFRGPIALVKLQDGSVSRGDRIRFMAAEAEYEVGEVGIMHPEMLPVQTLYAGQVGYIVANMKSIKEARMGDTVCSPGHEVEPFPGFEKVKPMVFAGLYPVDPADYTSLRAAVEKLALNDPAVEMEVDHSPTLGQGWRVGFLGVLHMEVFGQRLDQEYDASVILTSPSVKYKAVIKDNETIQKRYDGKAEVWITDPSKFPTEVFDVKEFMEPIVLATIISPMRYVEAIIQLCTDRRGSQHDFKLLEGDRAVLRFRLPLAEVIVDFFNSLKQITSGYASFDYEDAGYVTADVIKIDLSLNGRMVEDFSVVTPQATSRHYMDICVHCLFLNFRAKAREIVERLKEEIPRQLYDVDIVASFGKRQLAKGKIPAIRKDFTQTLKGNFGDPSRLNKLLKNQEKGKKRMKSINNVHIPKEAFLNVLRR